MTRFARAKGSKASNERVPEEATSWSEIKEQLAQKNQDLERSKLQKQAEEQRQANYQAFLDEVRDDELQKSEWADFPDAPKTEPAKPVKKVNKKTSKPVDSDSDGPPEETSSKIQRPKVMVKKAMFKRKPLKIVLESEQSEEQSEQKSPPKKRALETNDKGPAAKKLKKNNSFKITTTVEGQNDSDAAKSGQTNDGAMKKKKGKKGKKGKTPEKVKKDPSTLTEEELRRIEKKKRKNLKQIEKRKLKKQLQDENKAKESTATADGNAPNENGTNEMADADSLVKNVEGAPFKKPFEKRPFNGNAKPGKARDNEKHDRRKMQPDKMFINGKEVAIAYVDGFPVKKDDAERIQKLRKTMISKGLPRSEIKIAMKLERRRAEKAFARERKKVCFNCRKSGHNLSECPDLVNDQLVESAGTGICFKCGSTEHTHFECKVVKGQEYRFAKCFICQEQGHISRQCPDNAKGLYPKGGACRVCGDVTHLKRDCPQYQAQQKKIEDKFSVETLDGGNPEELDDTSEVKPVIKRPNKIIKF